ncbi:hypothetical protein AYK26_07495 [Euryarchaeota archaeon SM23-78]|nr:MAG: hypothetical protein AYK26_07495 [Euryarchaeota archaeon SM23-78]
MEFESKLVDFLDEAFDCDLMVLEIKVDSIEKFKKIMSEPQGKDIYGEEFTGERGYMERPDGTIEYISDSQGEVIIKE